jgi:hypothetical protein
MSSPLLERRPSDVERLLRFDTVRVSKLLEQVQFAVIVFIIAFFVGSMTDKLFPLPKEADKMSDFNLYKDLFLQLCLIVISAYYITKVAKVIPFFFSLSDKYIPSSHGENMAGAGLAMAIIFVGVQKNFQARIGILKNRFYP